VAITGDRNVISSKDEQTRIFFSGPGLPPVDGTLPGMEGLDVVAISRPGFDKLYITAHPSNHHPYSMFRDLARCVSEKGARIIQQFVFGGTELHGDGIKAIEETCGPISWPVTWIQGDGASGDLLTGTQAYAITGNDAELILDSGNIAGAVYEDDDAKYCLLGDLRPEDTSASREDQTREAFEKMEVILGKADMDFSHVVRTWMYLDKLLEWYDEFNEVRTQFFNERGVFERMVPASTGIGVGNHAGAALVTDVLAIKPKTDRVKVFAVPSPLQCPALDYKSSFSRAVEIQLPDHRQLLISGTASIEPGGATVHLDDTAKQIDLTMRVIDEILKSRDMSWTNTTRGIAYFKDVEDAPLLHKYCEDNNLPSMPVAIAHSDICRDDLLFEIEVDAAKTTAAE
jgi:enamine deaminase RidA (YjgF/YER057c/UK114 family)